MAQQAVSAVREIGGKFPKSRSDYFMGGKASVANGIKEKGLHCGDSESVVRGPPVNLDWDFRRQGKTMIGSRAAASSVRALANWPSLSVENS